MMMNLCAACTQPITDRFLLNVLDRYWHVSCVTCSDCQCPLADKCFTRGDQLYCQKDFFSRYGVKCGRCKRPIQPSDMVRRARDKIFHLKCFACSVCHKELATGEELYCTEEDNFICKADYVNAKEKPDAVKLCTSSNGVDCEEEESNADELDTCWLDETQDGMSDGETNSATGSDKQDKSREKSSPDLNGNGKRRGPRTTIKAKELEMLKSAFSSTPKPTRHLREKLAAETGLSIRVIQVWFQNRRSKERRMKQLNPYGTLSPFSASPLPHVSSSSGSRSSRRRPHKDNNIPPGDYSSEIIPPPQMAPQYDLYSSDENVPNICPPAASVPNPNSFYPQDPDHSAMAYQAQVPLQMTTIIPGTNIIPPDIDLTGAAAILHSRQQQQQYNNNSGGGGVSNDNNNMTTTSQQHQQTLPNSNQLGMPSSQHQQLQQHNSGTTTSSTSSNNAGVVSFVGSPSQQQPPPGGSLSDQRAPQDVW